MTCPEHDEVKAEVTGFKMTQDGDIAFAVTDDYGTVTFKLSLDVWSGNGPPQKGEVVILSGMSKFRRGWRARKPDDSTFWTNRETWSNPGKTRAYTRHTRVLRDKLRHKGETHVS